MKHKEALTHLKAITEEFGHDAEIELDQKAWAKLHAAIEEALAQPEQCKPLPLTDEQADKILETAEKVAPKYAGWVCDQRRAYVRAGYNAANGIKGDA